MMRALRHYGQAVLYLCIACGTPALIFFFFLDSSLPRSKFDLQQYNSGDELPVYSTNDGVEAVEFPRTSFKHTSKNTASINPDEFPKFATESFKNATVNFTETDDPYTDFFSTSESKSQVFRVSDEASVGHDRSTAEGPTLTEQLEIHVAKSSVEEDLADVGHVAKPKRVLFVTEYRSGSTFISTLLNKHPEIHYLFEPLFLSDDMRNIEANLTVGDPVQLKILNDYFERCQFPKTMNYLTSAMIKHAHLFAPERHYLYYFCRIEGFCFRHKSDIFKQPPFCPAAYLADGMRAPTLTRKCPHMSGHITLAEELCRRKFQVRSAKVIRLKTMRSIPAALRFDPDFKIVYLVRDPRAIANSRFKISSNNWSGNNIKRLTGICRMFHNFLHERRLNSATGNSLWNAAIEVVRFEDFALNPIAMAQRVYDFIGVDFPESVKNHLFKISHGHTELLEKSYEEKTCQYCTIRNSEKVIFRWRENLSYNITKHIQDNCVEMFDAFGYKRFDSEHDYESQRQSPSFSPLINKNCTTCNY